MADAGLIEQVKANAAAVVAALELVKTPRDWLEELIEVDGDALRSDEAAFVADCHPDTIRDRAKAAAKAGRPLGFLLAASLWLISRRRLLDQIETKEGRPARLAAESRARKIAETRSRPELLPEKPMANGTR